MEDGDPVERDDEEPAPGADDDAGEEPADGGTDGPERPAGSGGGDGSGDAAASRGDAADDEDADGGEAPAARDDDGSVALGEGDADTGEESAPGPGPSAGPGSGSGEGGEAARTGDASEGSGPDSETGDEGGAGPVVAAAETDAAGESAAEGGGSAAATADPPADPGADGTSDENAEAAATAEAPEASEPGRGATESESGDGGTEAPDRVQKYDRFKKIESSRYERVNDFLRDRTYITAREWAIARLCSDFRTETGVEMTLIGENLPDLIPFMTDTYTPQAVNQARTSFRDKVKKAGATFLYGSMSGFFTTEELDDVMYEVTETARFLLEVEGAEVAAEHEMEVEDRISDAMREIQEDSAALRAEETEHTCPHCGGEFTEDEEP